jgi:hypothetical protein
VKHDELTTDLLGAVQIQELHEVAREPTAR